MTPRQYNEYQRQVTVTKTRVQRFIELQTTINNQIDWDGQANEQLADELDELGRQLTDYEIGVLSAMMYEDALASSENDDVDDIEWEIK